MQQKDGRKATNKLGKGPWNTVCRDERFVGIIEWDFARPGYPIEDLAQLVWDCVPLRPDEDCRATASIPHSAIPA